jgi:hypothetical protein
MSRGPGKLQTFIMDALRMSSVPTSAIKLRAKLSWEIWDPDNGDPDFKAWNTPARRRSIRMSMGRALRQLEGRERLSETRQAIGIRPRIGLRGIRRNVNANGLPTTRRHMPLSGYRGNFR